MRGNAAASRALALLFALLAFAASSSARAQTEGPPPEYRGLVDSALEEFDAQHWAEARALFERAHAIFPNARTLRGMGMAAFELRDYVAARRALDASLTETRRALTDEQRTQVSELAARARVFVGDFQIGPAPSGSVVAVDGAPVAVDGDITQRASLPLAVGAHEIALRAPDGRTERAQLTVHGGESAALALAILEPPARALEPAPDPTPTPAPTPQPTPTSTSADVGWAWGLTIGGGVLVIAGAVLLGLGASDAAFVSSAVRGVEWSDLSAAYSRVTPLEAAGGVALGVGVALAIVGVVGVTMTPSSTTSISVGPGSLTLRGSF